MASMNRPSGIVVIVVLWTLSSIYNLYIGLNGVLIDIAYLPLLSDPTIPQWFRVGLPAEMIISFFVVMFAFLTLLVVYGLWTAKSWSYDFAFVLPLIIIVLNFWLAVLYSSAPVETGITGQVGGIALTIFLNIVWLFIILSYLRQPHVKHYLKGTPLPSTPTLPPPPPPSLFEPSEKKFCRYCGNENKTDAVFCEKCGKKIG
jgi:hypothetical protein